MVILAEHFQSAGLSTAPAQLWRNLRLVPVLSQHLRQDLRLSRRVIESGITEVSLPDDSRYTAYIPHAFVMQWRDDGSAVVSPGTQLKAEAGVHWKETWVQPLHRMSKREKKHQLRFLPLHLAMELFLAEHFNGPEIDWRMDYRRSAISEGLNPRYAEVMQGEWIFGLAEALRVFEIYPNQVGLLLFINDHLATVAIYPHPDDYRALHRAMLSDMFNDWFWYANIYPVELYHLAADAHEPPAASWDELRTQLHQRQGALDDFQRWMTQGVLAQPMHLNRVYQAGSFALQRFRAEMGPTIMTEAHMGEIIHDHEGQLRYLKSYRLNKEQIQQCWFLEKLAENHWHLERTAEKHHMTKDQWVLKMEKIGLGRLLQPKLMDQARKRLR